jgi:ferrous iron transport protein A
MPFDRAEKTGAFMNRTLDQLKDGEWARVEAVLTQGRIRRRLVEMGITPGAGIRLIRRAPPGDPMEIELRGYRLTIRRKAARGIRMTGGGGP